jgi:hypothetical protein
VLTTAFVYRALSLVCFAITSVACSCLGSAHLVNATSAPAEVELWLGSSYRSGSIGVRNELLGITPQLDTARPWNSQWIPLDSSVQIDSSVAGLRLRLVLAPSSGLRVGQIAADCAGGILGVVLPDSVNVRGRVTASIAGRELVRRGRRHSRATYVYSITP